MGKDFTDDFFREVYSTELDHKHKLDSADSLLVGILLALSGVVIYYFKVLPSCRYGIAGCVYLFLSAVFLIAFGFAIGFVIASFWPRYKGYISNPQDWGQFVAGLETYYNHYHDEKEAKERVADELSRTLRQQYIKASEINRNINNKKMGYQARAKYCITAAVMILALNGYPTYLIQCAKSDTQKTEVVKFPEVQKIEIVTSNTKDESDDRGKEATHTPAFSTTDPTTRVSTAKTTTPRNSATQGRPDPRDNQEGKVTSKE